MKMLLMIVLACCGMFLAAACAPPAYVVTGYPVPVVYVPPSWPGYTYPVTYSYCYRGYHMPTAGYWYY